MTDLRDEVRLLAADLRGHLQYEQLQHAGAPQGALAVPSVEPPPAPTPQPQAPQAQTLAALREELGDCRRCGLCERRNSIVFGAGSERARIVFVGEGPGYHEDQQGEPFVGASGELLTTIINNVLGRERGDVYICNVVKCRPPDNRDPAPDEVAACSPFLRRQVDLLRPEIIVALGRFAAQTLLDTRQSTGRLRGRVHSYRGASLIVTYHPSYLLRSPQEKRKAMDDMMLVRQEFARRTGEELPPIQRRRGARR